MFLLCSSLRRSQSARIGGAILAALLVALPAPAQKPVPTTHYLPLDLRSLVRAFGVAGDQPIPQRGL